MFAPDGILYKLVGLMVHTRSGFVKDNNPKIFSCKNLDKKSYVVESGHVKGDMVGNVLFSCRCVSLCTHTHTEKKTRPYCLVSLSTVAENKVDKNNLQAEILFFSLQNNPLFSLHILAPCMHMWLLVCPIFPLLGKEMIRQIRNIKPNTRPTFETVRDFLNMQTADIMLTGSRIVISMPPNSPRRHIGTGGGVLHI